MKQTISRLKARLMTIDRPGRLIPLLLILFSAGEARAQLLKQGDLGAGVTISIYQFDDQASKPFPLVTSLKARATSPQEEVALVSRQTGAAEIRLRHVKSVGLREGEAFTDSQPMNDRPFTFTIDPRIITREDLTLDFTASYDGRTLLEVKGVTVGTNDTLALRGQSGGFAVREFAGPGGTEKAPTTRALLVTIALVIQNTKALQNRPSDISRPTDQFGSRITLDRSDIFVMPTLTSRAPLNFAPGSRARGSITLEGIITPDGRVTNVRVLDTPDPALNPKAVEAFRQYRFTPAKLNGRETYATYRETILLEKPRDL
ncbi:MAG: energy transducer TonB [Blastocatellia bacterium]